MELPHVVGVVGVGLVGGSFIRALRASSWRPRVVAVDPDAHVRARLSSESLADEVAASIEVAPLVDCDVVVLAAPVAAIEAMLAPVSARMRDGATLTDVAGVKAPILAAARSHVKSSVFFVGAHPMFGGEGGGFDASTADRWTKGVVAVCEEGEGAAVERVASLHRALGADVVLCAAEAHDLAVAAVSHAPYVVASALALVARDAGSLARRLAGRGFADATRLARFAYDVQGEVARRNAHLRATLVRFRDELDRLVHALDASESEGARAAFEAARAARGEIA